MTALNFFFIRRFCKRVQVPDISPPFPIYFMAVAEIAEAINARGSLRELPEGTLPHTALKL